MTLGLESICVQEDRIAYDWEEYPFYREEYKLLFQTIVGKIGWSRNEEMKVRAKTSVTKYQYL